MTKKYTLVRTGTFTEVVTVTAESKADAKRRARTSAQVGGGFRSRPGFTQFTISKEEEIG